jgi:PmbA protein
VNTEDLLARYLAECTRLGLRGEVRAVEQRRAELVARNGAIESEGTTIESLVSLTASDGDRWTVVAGGTDVDPAVMVAEARALLECTRGDQDHRPPVSGAGWSRRYPGRTPAPDESSRDRVIAASVLPGARECEVRAAHTARTVRYATPEGVQEYPTSHASLMFRATRTGPDGEPVHVDRADSGPSLGWLLEQLAGHEAADCEQQLRAPSFPASARLPEAVVVGRHVAAQLLWLFGEALSAEAVVQSRSGLAGRLGRQVSAPLITVADDPCYPAGPRCQPVDDEGVPGERRVLIDQGWLLGYLGSRGHLCPGARPGNARQADVATAPRPAASNLLVSPGTEPLSTDGPLLWVTQTHGMHLANPITGDFSAGAAGVVLSATGAWRAAGLTLAGNVFDMFRQTEAIGDRICWTDDAESSFGAPDLRVTELTVGR